MYDLAQTRDLEAKVLVGQLSIAAHSRIGDSRQPPLCRHCSRTRAQGRNRGNRLAFSKLAMLSPLVRRRTSP
jgi:hypothetical protein